MARKVDQSESISWEQYWSWFNSSIVSDAERRKTFQYFLDASPLEGMPYAAKVEVLEYAPPYIVNYLFKEKIIDEKLLNDILGIKVEPVRQIQPMNFKAVVQTLKG